MTVTEGPTSKDENCIAVGGTTWPLKNELTKLGFEFHETVNNEEGVNLWLGPKDTVNLDALITLCDKFGFAVEQYDGVAP